MWITPTGCRGIPSDKAAPYWKSANAAANAAANAPTTVTRADALE